MSTYVPPRIAVQRLGVCARTLERWEKEGKIKRKGLIALLERIYSGDIGMVVVASKDRLCRFGFDLISWFAQRGGCKILVLNNSTLSPEREMVEDMLAIIQVFSCRLYGLGKYKKQIIEDPDVPGLPKERNQESLDVENSCQPESLQ